MKLIGFWLLVLLAVLVPATAAIATSMICPTASVAKAPLRGLAAKAHATASGAHALSARAGARDSSKAAAADAQADHCCDLTPCSQCAGCGTCASIAASAGLGAHVHPLVVARLPEGGGPRAEFLLSGQERPPRTT